MTSIVKTLLGAAAVSFAAMSASAATCDASYALAVDDFVGVGGTNDGCFLGLQNQVKLETKNNAATVNEELAFTYSDWSFAGKQNIGGAFESGIDIDFTVSDDPFSGTWSVISTLFDTYTDLMIVLKGGAGNIDPDKYVAYLFSGSGTAATSGDFETAFSNANNGNDAGISNISAWVRGDTGGGGGGNPPPVPVPASLPLLLGALGVSGFVLNRRKRKS